MRRLFVFRPEPAARRTLEAARALGLDPISVPLFELQQVDWAPPEPADFDGLLLTSANAVTMAGEGLDRYRELPVHAVGEGTAMAARVAGLGVATVGEGGVDVLLAKVDPKARILHLCGEEYRPPDATRPAITVIPIYRASEKTKVPGLEALRGHVAVVHSPRAARRLAQLIGPEHRSAIRIAAISETAAQAVGQGWEQVHAASAPNDKVLLALCTRLCET